LTREQRRLAAIVSADIAGYSRLMGRDESGTLAAMKALRRNVVDPPIAAHGGRIVKTTGDGLLIEFPSVVDAVRCVVEVQTAMVERGGDIAFRIGVNLGDIIIDGDDIFGEGVNIAARLQEIASPGGICVSSRVYDDVRDRLDALFEKGGAQNLKNIARPVEIWRWSPGAVVPAPLPTVEALHSLPDRPSIAVLPFQNMSGDVDQQYFVDGLVDDIITALSRISAFFVIARNSSFTYKGRMVDVRQIGRELGVRYVLEGSVRKSGNRLRITGQLVDATTGNHIWADRYEGALKDVFDLQDRITSSVVAVIEPKVREAEITRAQAKPTENLTAYDLYLRAFAVVADFEEESIGHALAMLTRAVAIDPRFSTAHGQISAYNEELLNRGWGSFEEITKRGLEAAKLAVETGRDDPRALASGAQGIARFGGNIEEALVHSERALALAPDSVYVRRMSGWTCTIAGRHEQAVEHFKRAMQLDPMDPWAFVTHRGVAYPYFFTGRYDEALEWLDKALAERPNLVNAFRLQIAALVMAGRPYGKIQEVIGRLRMAESDVSITKLTQRVAHFRQVDLELYAKALRLAGLPE
jgi:adenylate cyclase